jgi:hypothetical protein
MKKRILHLCVVLSLFCAFPQPARADLFGGDVVVLTQILAQAIMQLAKLRDLMGNAQSHLDLIRQINQGINDSLRLLKTIDPNLDPGIYKEWATVNDALSRLTDIYGFVPESPEARVQKDTDQGIAEAVTFNNSFYKYSEAYDVVAERIKEASHSVSPGGAQKLTAQALGVVIQLMNQQLRAQSSGMKLQAHQLALENRKDKAETKLFVDNKDSLRAAMKSEKVRFQQPRF